MTREASRDEANLFADEVCVDFPSVAPAIERVRQSFLADERPETLHAAIELTGREAARGTTVPLNVPVHCTCSSCGGRGESWTETCSLCRGSGFELLHHSVQITVPPGVRNGARFCFEVTPRHNRSTRIELHVVVAAGR
jgi:DnaJ-class molecular chaperone